MNALISMFGMLLSTIGLGTSTYSQVQMMRNQPTPPAQTQTYQCPPGTQPQMERMPDGSYRIQCVQTVPVP